MATEIATEMQNQGTQSKAIICMRFPFQVCWLACVHICLQRFPLSALRVSIFGRCGFLLCQHFLMTPLAKSINYHSNKGKIRRGKWHQELRTLFPLKAFKNAPNPNLSNICPSDCVWRFQSGGLEFVEHLSNFVRAVRGKWVRKGYSFSAYSWKLPAYSGAFLLTIVFGSFFAYSFSFFTYNFVFLLAVDSVLLTAGKRVS